MAKDHKEPKPGRLARLKGYPMRRLGLTRYGRLSAVIRSDGHSAIDALKPKKISREELIKGYLGRHEDGGRKQFEIMAAQMNLKKEDLAARERHLQIAAYLFAGASGMAILLLIMWPLIAAGIMVAFSIIGFFILSLLFLAIAVKYDFGAWQIRRQRFGGLRDYMNDRF